MHDAVTSYGYPSLFLLSFLASTLLPIGSEWLLIALLMQRHDPVSTVITATIGNYLGACTSYFIGMYGGTWFSEKILRIDAGSRKRAEYYFARYGSWSLLFSWLPIIGDPLCLAGGLLKIPFTRFSLLVVTGKCARYALIAWLTLKGIQHVSA